ncbi:hypothetical protein MNBD_ALPHA06-1541 [hydrothermal vent metagenome]|uniref:Uncharacterized protein n=1 Tax=hydrothermal vent metagenome TaxID=652676 RepID=A0A3B0S6J0_9ZZZZ
MGWFFRKNEAAASLFGYAVSQHEVHCFAKGALLSGLTGVSSTLVGEEKSWCFGNLF